MFVPVQGTVRKEEVDYVIEEIYIVLLILKFTWFTWVYKDDMIIYFHYVKFRHLQYMIWPNIMYVVFCSFGSLINCT